MPCRLRFGLASFSLLLLVAGLGTAAVHEEPSVLQLLGAAADARRQAQSEKAATLYGQVLDRDPGNRLALYNAGILLENLGRGDLALGVWSRALQAHPGDLFAYDHLLRNLHQEDLETLIAQEAPRLAGEPGSTLRRLRLGLAFMASGRPAAAVAPLEAALLIRPASNIAFLFLKDAFWSAAAKKKYLEDLAGRAMARDASENLRLLHLRFLLDAGQWQLALKLARRWEWPAKSSRELLVRAGLLESAETASRAVSAGADTSEASRTEMAEAAPAEAPPDSAGEDTPAAAVPPAIQPETPGGEDPSRLEEPPDFGPKDPRSAPYHLTRSEAARARNDETDAMLELRRALEAAPLLTQPRILLALMLEGADHPAAARQALKGPLAVSPWDLYMQAWRTVRDEYIDPDPAGVNLYSLRLEARDSVRTVPDAKAEIRRLLAALHDRYAHLFPPPQFAGYLLAPNAGRSTASLADQVAAGESWLTLPEPPPLDSPRESPPAVSSATGSPVIGGAGQRASHGTGGSPGGNDEAVFQAVGTAECVVPVDQEAQTPEEETGERSVPGQRRGVDATGKASASGPLQESPDVAARGARGGGVPDSTHAGGVRGRRLQVRPGPEARDPVMQAEKVAPGIGYIRIPTLNGLDVPARLDRALLALAGSRAVILDLRGNGGGDGGIAVQVASRFLAAGTTVCTYLTRHGPDRLRATGAVGQHFSGRLVVLVDGVTASAAEILAAALRDEAGAVLLGERTAGKGVGQRALLLPDGSGLSLTRVVLEAPGGQRWDGKGLVPTVDSVAVRQPAGGRVVADLPLKKALELMEEEAQP